MQGIAFEKLQALCSTQRLSCSMGPVVLLLLNLMIVSPALANLEGDALHAFKVAVTDPNGMLESWDPTLVNPCTWLYVTCSEDELVTRVDLAHASLSGKLVPELANLKSLKYLELFNNNLSGSIPQEFGNMKQLISLDLQHNAVSGQIPTSLGRMSSLVFLRLNNNKLSGQIPGQLTAISGLQVLDLSYNNLSGPVPRSGSFKRFTSKSFEGNPGLCGQVVNKAC